METIKINEMLRQIRDSNYERTKHFSDQELMAYFHETAIRVHEQLYWPAKPLRQPFSEPSQVK